MSSHKNTINQLVEGALNSDSFSLIDEEEAFSSESLASTILDFQAVLEQFNAESVLLASPKCKDSICLIFSLIKKQGSFICSYRSGRAALWLKQLAKLPVDVLAIHESLIEGDDETLLVKSGAIKSLKFYWLKQREAQTQCLLPGIGFYSSGTTSKPKAVIHPYKAISDYLLWGQKTFKLSKTDKFLFTTELSFIASLRPLLFPVVGEHTMVIAPPYLLLDAEKFLNFIKQSHITIISTTPSFLRHLSLAFKSQENFSSSLRLILLSGEPCDPNVIKLTYRFFNYRIKIYDIYGATEILAPFYKELPVKPNKHELKHLGSVRNGYSFQFISFKNNYYQLFIGGAITANYINPIAKDRHFGFKNGTRYYLSDDLFVLRNHAFILSTRKQSLIKHFGLLINLRAIEEEILQLPTISDCTVIFNEELSQVEAYVVSTDENELIETIKTQLNQALPAYMHPKVITILDKMPVNRHGKTDTKKLTQKLPAINETTTIEGLTACLQPAAKAKHKVKTFLPLCNTQRIIVKLYYLLNQSQLGSHSHTFKLKDNLCLNKLDKAIIDTIQNHFMLSCQLKSHRGEYLLKHVRPPKSALHHFVITWLMRLKRQIVPLSSKRLFNAYIFKTNKGHFLRLNFHQLVQDGWSMWRVVSEIFYRYDEKDYTHALTFEDEASLILNFAQAEEQSSQQQSILSIPKGYEYFNQHEYQPALTKDKHHKPSQSYFRVPKAVLLAFQTKHHLGQFSMKTVILLVYSLAVSKVLEVNTLPIAITLSKRGMPLENLIEMISPCVTPARLVIPFHPISLEQTAEVIEHDLHLLFSYACSNQIFQLSQTTAYQAITPPSVVYTYVDLSHSDSSIMNKYIDWKQSTFDYQNFLNHMLFIRAYDMNEQILFFINNRFSKDLNQVIKKQIAQLLRTGVYTLSYRLIIEKNR